jgi:hypothetical protein
MGAKGRPTLYRDPNVEEGFNSPGYDNRGNLFVEAGDICISGPCPQDLDELAAGTQTLTPLTLSNFSLGESSLGGVMWDGKYLAVGQVVFGGNTNINRIVVSDGIATSVSQLTLTARCGTNYQFQFWIAGHTLVGGFNTACGQIGYWRYPKGGDPAKAIKPSEAPKFASGVTVSVARSR